jgi:hypothetical protein
MGEMVEVSSSALIAAAVVVALVVSWQGEVLAAKVAMAVGEQSGAVACHVSSRLFTTSTHYSFSNSISPCY